MKPKDILCPVDFSPLSEVGVSWASRIARKHGSTLHFVHVYEPILSDGDLHAVRTDVTTLNEQLQQQKAAFEGIPTVHEVLYGFPASALVSYADQHEIDLIVIGTHGRTGASRLLMGSVAEAVIRSANCPVLTVHEHSQAKEAKAS